VWIVTCAYSSAPLASDEIEWESNPLNERADVTWDAQQYTRPYFADKDGNAIVNAARRYFDPPVEGDDSRLVVTVRKNVVQVPTWVLSFRNSINDRPFQVDGVAVATRCAKMAGIALTNQQERNGVSFRVLTFTLHLDEDTWIKKILNDGYSTRDGAKCKDKDGVEVTEPAMLAADGTQLAFPVNPTLINFISASIYKEKNFNLLPLS
jgi:hypothetical protein